jgi:sporulation protein YlmC with PRC-barrel domain
MMMKTMKKMFTAGTITVFGLGLVVAATAQQQQQQSPQERAQPERSPQERMIEGETENAEQPRAIYHRSEDLIGSRVVNAEGDRLGTVHDLAVQLEDGLFSYAIVEAGGFLGIGGEWHPVPPGALRVQEARLGIELVLNISESQWENAPTVEEDQIQQLAQDNRAQEIYDFYGQDWQEQQDTEFAAPERNARNVEDQQPDQQQEQNDGQDQQAEQQEQQQQEEQFGARQQAEAQAQPQLRMARDVTDMDLVNEQQEEIGQIRDLLVNVEEGRVGFVLFSEGAGLFQVGGEEYAVAPQALRVEDERAILNVTQQQLEQAQTLTAAQVAMQAQEQADLDPEEARESPEVFRFQEEDDQNGVFAAPDRDDTETRDNTTDETRRQNGSPDVAPQQQEQQER